MNGLRPKVPMCRRPLRLMELGDYWRGFTRDPGSTVNIRTTEFRDGSCIVHRGGPVGDKFYGPEGEEC